MKLAVIPARGGSKRIPRKNVKLFGGKPMIAWSIEAAIKAAVFDSVIVSTDDSEIAKIALEYNANVPFERPAELSGDNVGTAPVISHAINWHVENGIDVSQVCCIYATAPFITEEDIKLGKTLLDESGADFVVSITSYAYPIQRAIKLRKDGRLEMFEPSQFEMRSQDLTECFHDAGQFYWGTTKAWLSAVPVLSAHAVPLILPRYRVQDIDTMEDWKNAELMFQSLPKL